MSVLFMMPEWRAYSEAWMQRMLESLAPHVAGIAVWNTGGERTWRGKTPAFSLQRRSLARRALRAMGVGVSDPGPEAALGRLIDGGAYSRVLCHYGHFATAFMDVWRRTSLPLFVHIHGADATFDLRQHHDPGRPVHEPAYREKLLELAGRATFIATTEFVRGLLTEQGIPEARIVLKPLGVPEYPLRRHEPRAQVVIVSVGRFVDFKSPDRTILAFERACEQGLQARLVMAGDGPLRAACELLRIRSRFRERIVLLGAVDPAQVAGLLAEADIFTQHNVRGELSGQAEAFGVSIVEAMSAGIPVVGTRSGGVPSVVVDGSTGLLVEPGDVEAQARALLTVASDPELRARMGAAAQHRVRSHFSLEGERRRAIQILGLGDA